MLRIINAKWVTPHGIVEGQDCLIQDGVFVEELDGNGEVLDAEGCYLCPGLIDIHTHGRMGSDFMGRRGDARRAEAADAAGLRAYPVPVPRVSSVGL